MSKTLNEILDLVFEESAIRGMTLKQLASRAGLCTMTVVRLDSRITRFPQYRTVELLAKAVGMELVLNLHKRSKKSA